MVVVMCVLVIDGCVCSVDVKVVLVIFGVCEVL